MGHFIKVCKHCKKVMEQCRCPDLNKQRTYGVCEDCQKTHCVQPVHPCNQTQAERLQKQFMGGYV